MSNNTPKILNLSSKQRWIDPDYREMIVLVLENYGCNAVNLSLVKNALTTGKTSSFEDFSMMIKKIAALDNKNGENLLSSLDKLLEEQNYNANCYITNTPERSMTIRWPNNPRLKEQNPDLYFDITQTNFCRQTHRIIKKETAVGSAGSCFATRIAHQLQKWDYNYVLEEDDLPENYPLEFLADSVFRSSSARLGNLFHPASLRQMVERAFGLWSPEKILVRDEQKGWIDPFRRVYAYYEDFTGFEEDFKTHTNALKRALKRSEVFIITLGSTEAWQFIHSGDFLSEAPHPEIDPCLLKRKNFTGEESLAELERFYSVFKRFNPKVKIITTVSPIPLYKTYSKSNHVVPATMYAKSKLLVAANRLAENHPDDVFYFPSFETVLFGSQDPWLADKRHISLNAVQRVMTLFQYMFIEDQSKLPPLRFAEELTPTAYALRWLRQKFGSR